MNKTLAIIGGALVLASTILPWYGLQTPLGDLSLTLFDMYDFSQGLEFGGYSFGGNQNFQLFVFLVIGSGMLGVIGGIISSYLASLVGGIGSVGGAALFALALMDSELGIEALMGSITYLGATVSWGVSLGFGLVIIGGFLLLFSK